MEEPSTLLEKKGEEKARRRCRPRVFSCTAEYRVARFVFVGVFACFFACFFLCRRWNCLATKHAGKQFAA